MTNCSQVSTLKQTDVSEGYCRLAFTLCVLLVVFADAGCSRHISDAHGWRQPLQGGKGIATFVYATSKGGDVLFMVVSLRVSMGLDTLGGEEYVVLDDEKVAAPPHDGMVYVVADGNRIVRTEVWAEPLVKAYLKSIGSTNRPEVELPEELTARLLGLEKAGK